MGWVGEVKSGGGGESLCFGFTFMKGLKFRHLRLCANKAIIYEYNQRMLRMFKL